MGGESGGAIVKKFIAAVLLLLVVAGVVVAFVFPELWRERLGKKKPPESKRVHCRELGISIEIPEGWTSEVSSVGTPVLIATSPAGESVRVNFRRVPTGADPEKFVREWVGRLKNRKYREWTSMSPADGTFVWKVTWSTVSQTPRRDGFSYAMIKGERIYTMSCSADHERFKEQQKVLEGIAESLSFEAPAKE